MIHAILIENGKLAAVIDGKIYTHTYNIICNDGFNSTWKYRNLAGKKANLQYWNYVREASIDETPSLNTWN
jgi:hypothetical protein